MQCKQVTTTATDSKRNLKRKHEVVATEEVADKHARFGHSVRAHTECSDEHRNEEEGRHREQIDTQEFECTLSSADELERMQHLNMFLEFQLSLYLERVSNNFS